jgi:hypothetical protein
VPDYQVYHQEQVEEVEREEVALVRQITLVVQEHPVA